MAVRTKLTDVLRNRRRDICSAEEIAIAIGGETPNKGECVNRLCSECAKEWLSKLADAIDREAEDAAESAANGMPRDAEGVRCLLGDTVWHPYHGRCVVVCATWTGKVAIRQAEHANSGKGARYVMASEVSHRKPADSMEKIELDARENWRRYWNCVGSDCLKCTSTVGGKTPMALYRVVTCEDAKALDLLRRQRGLLEGGES